MSGIGKWKRFGIALSAAFLVIFAVPQRLVASTVSAPEADSRVIDLRVDVTDVEHGVFKVTERIPVRPGPMTLLYPQWLPGNHAPRGTISGIAGLAIVAAGRPLEWVRSSTDVFAFKVQVPRGITHVDVQFEYATPLVSEQGRTAVTPEIIGLQWNSVVLYPAGSAQARIVVSPSLVLPDNWQFGTALHVKTREGGLVAFQPISLEMLVDSPIFAGKNFKRIDLDPGAKRPVTLAIVADRAADLEMTDEQINLHRRLVKEMTTLFGSRHFDHYEFLLALSDDFGAIGLEHHRSSENRRPARFFTEWEKYVAGRDLLSHEMTHSWNGKFRRPAGQFVSDFNTPMQNDLLWVYEGLTQYYGHVVAARAGLWSEEMARDVLAQVAAELDRNRPGRAWRSLQDTTNQPVVTPRLPLSYQSWQRREDYYQEGELIWLDVDTRIRELTEGRRSLDDFAKAFFGVRDGDLGPMPYTFDDIVSALNSVAPSDWRAFLRSRLDGHGPGAPLEGIARAGWKLVFKDSPSSYLKAQQKSDETLDLSSSLGMRISTRDGSRVSEVAWGSPAFAAGIKMGDRLVAVNGASFKSEAVVEAIKQAAATRSSPIELIIRNGDRFRVVQVPYYDGLRYPHLERVKDMPDRLAAILKGAA